MDATDRIVFAQTGRGTRIGTARDTLGALKAGMKLVAWLATQAGAMWLPFKATVQGAVKAEINHGRWIVRCPACSGAEEADPGEPIFFCLSCGNDENGGHVMQVVFPGDQGAIEWILLKREMGNRNWVPGESLFDVALENVEHDSGAVPITTITNTPGAAGAGG